MTRGVLCPGLEDSIAFLRGYRDVLLQSKQDVERDAKGKKHCCLGTDNKQKRADPTLTERQAWLPPTPGHVKINVDGTYVDHTEEAGVGVLARDHTGAVCFWAWRVLFNCVNAPEAEIRACVEGLRLASQWIRQPVILETDCARIAAALRTKEDDLSEIGFYVREAKELIQLIQAVEIVQVKRERNYLAHKLAHLARKNVLLYCCLHREIL